AGLWLTTVGGWLHPFDVIVAGKPGGDWWRPLTAPFVHYGGGGQSLFAGGAYQFIAMFAVAIYGWLLERRHGGFVVLSLFLAGGAGGAVAAAAAYPVPVLCGANGAALALLCAWALPDFLAFRRGEEVEG